MARNRKPEYIKKLLGVNAPNGYKFDAFNYLYNPNTDFDYPSFRKAISKDAEKTTYRSVHYIKYWDGTGHYVEEVFTVPKKEENGWHICGDFVQNHLEDASRFNLTKLLSFC